ncbi:uncharacterized protein LOC110109828, partial [Dendrobium catenatum]|uniref:uncharacterized protein LOC110109828 n=1 Tax=Dendrobium catenatum TaxID=906689 RepID=UPI00109F867B
PPGFEGAIEPRAAEEWLRRLEKTFDGMQCPADRKVPLAVFLLDGEAEHWWVGQQEAKFQGRLNSLITLEEFTEVFQDWFVPPSARKQMQETFLRLVQGSKTVMQYEAEFTALARYAPQLVSTSAEKCYRFPLRNRTTRKRFGGEASGSDSSGKRRFVAGSGSGVTIFDSRRSGGSSGTATSTTSSGSVSMAPVCQNCGRRHFGQCYRMAGLCFRCGQPGHRIAECPQMGFDRRSEFRSEGSVRPVSSEGRLRTVPPRPEGFFGRG